LIEIVPHLGISVVAKGIETKVQASQICGWGADSARASPSQAPPIATPRPRCCGGMRQIEGVTPL
jgi:hypothetical protein